ncbi:MAG: transporter substrate-binding protein [Alphaproteobacteria bacterium]|nr:transporter substrate-binding protein [Alphaproteobacteria bacterium]MCY4320243.1 transporter substrate-binding protein [Alphaproteobacteria bacterium]
MKLNRRHFIATASAAALASPAIIGRALAADGIKFVSILDQSNGLDIYGKPMVDTTRMAVDEINAAGGLLGRPIDLKVYDPQSSIQLYTQFATQAAAGDRADVVHAGITSASREAIRPTFSRFQVLYFYNVLYEGGVCDINNFCTGSTPAQTVEKLVPYTMNKWGKKVYIIAADYNYGQITAQWVQKYVRDNGGDPVATEFFPLDVTNFGPTIKKIQQARPDMVMSALVGGAHVSFYRQYAAAGMNASIPIASTTFGVGNEHKLISAEEGNGMICAYSYFEEIDNAANKAFVKRFRDRLGADAPALNELAARAYEGAYIWAEAVKQAGTAERMAVIEALRSGVHYDGPSGRVQIEPRTNHANQNVYLAELKDQSFQILETYENQPPTDTLLVCDLVKDPSQSTFKFENGLKAAGIDI